jgi:hypothetical protein
MPFLSREAGQRPHAFAVLGDRAMSGPVYSNGKEIGTLGAIRIVSNWLDDWTVVKTDPWQADDGERQDRLIRGFGKEAYRRLRDAHVAIIGCGGGASHVYSNSATSAWAQ